MSQPHTTLGSCSLLSDASHLIELEEEREHHSNLQRYNQELQVAVNRATEQQTTLDSELIKLRHEMMALKIDKQRQKKVLIEQKELDVPEVKKVEYLLGWKIEAVKREYTVSVSDD